MKKPICPCTSPQWLLAPLIRYAISNGSKLFAVQPAVQAFLRRRWRGVLLNAIFEQAELHWTLVGALAYLAFGALNVFLLPFAALTGGRLQERIMAHLDERHAQVLIPLPGCMHACSRAPMHALTPPCTLPRLPCMLLCGAPRRAAHAQVQRHRATTSHARSRGVVHDEGGEGSVLVRKLVEIVVQLLHT